MVTCATLKRLHLSDSKASARFSQIRVSGEANFGSAQFRSGADFYNAPIEGPTLFRTDYSKIFRRRKNLQVEEEGTPNGFDDSLFPPARFDGTRSRFRDAYFGGELNFHAAMFNTKADFTYVQCQGSVFFCEPLAPEKT